MVGKVGVTLNLSVNKRVRSWHKTDFEKRVPTADDGRNISLVSGWKSDG